MMDPSEPLKKTTVAINKDGPSLAQLLLIRAPAWPSGPSGFNTFHFLPGLILCEFVKGREREREKKNEKKKPEPLKKLSRRITITTAINNLLPLLAGYE